MHAPNVYVFATYENRMKLNIARLQYKDRRMRNYIQSFALPLSHSLYQTNEMELSEREEKRGRGMQENNDRNRPETLSESMIALLKPPRANKTDSKRMNGWAGVRE